MVERGAGRFLLRVLLRPAPAGPDLLAVDHGGADERAVVRRPLRRERDVLDALALLRELLLEQRLVVDRLGERLLDPVVERVDDRGGDVLEPVLEVDGGEHRLHQRGHDVRAAAQIVGDLALLLQAPVEPDLGGDDGARTPGDDVRANLRKLPLRELRVPVVQRACDDEAEHAVPEELEPLVGLDSVVRLRGVAEDLLEPLRREPVDQLLESGAATGAR